MSDEPLDLEADDWHMAPPEAWRAEVVQLRIRVADLESRLRAQQQVIEALSPIENPPKAGV